MAGKSIKTVAHVLNPRHVQLIPLQCKFLVNHIPFKTDDDLRQIIENHLKILLVMKGLLVGRPINL